MFEKGKEIKRLLGYIQQYYSEIALVIKKLDDLMKKKGWNPLDSAVAKDCSKSVDNPEKWFPYMNYRVYAKTKKSNLMKIVLFCHDHEGYDQPKIIAGLVEYKSQKSINEWTRPFILWNLWVEEKNSQKKFNGYIYKKFNTPAMKEAIKTTRLFGYNLTDIKNEIDIEQKLFNKLINL